MNLAITINENEVYSFGKEIKKDHLHTPNGRVHETHFEKVLDDNHTHVSSFVSCAKQHYVSISIPHSIPYSWGDNTGFRCGYDQIDQTPDTEFDVESDIEYEENLIPEPRPIPELTNYIINNQVYNK